MPRLSDDRAVPVLITLDVHDEEGVPRSVKPASGMLARLGIKATFFYVACVVEKTPGFESLQAAGHEIGCHGLYHKGTDEHYNSMPVDIQKRYLEEATDIIARATGNEVKSFRAPVYKISVETLRILESLGYAADVSVNSRRLGLFGSEPFNFRWLAAPPMPYHPSYRSPFRRGGMRIWEIPVSAMLIPFVTAAGQLFGETFLKAFFDMLYRESLRTGKPIVFGCHPEEFNPDRNPIKFSRERFSPVEFFPTMARGFDIRYRFYQYDPKRLFDMVQGLLEHIKGHKRVRFMTASEYAAVAGQNNR